MARVHTVLRVVFSVLLAAILGLGPTLRLSAGGCTWVALGPEGRIIRALAIDPQTPSTLYAGTDAGVFQSRDAGATWRAVSVGLANTDVQALAIDPQSPSTLYAGTWDRGVFQSRDAGATWRAVNAGLTNTDVNALAIDPHTPSRLYAGTWGGGVFVLRCALYWVFLPLMLRNR